ncbi:Carbonic anhydrase 2 [Wickerhamomyces ciferrii]|uniref:Carbonic anhydrase n=1 Tax=Wickerhamomyces ciferrii (strain ATCC 14091 / BCRC 22168 / CBS 111 / JCM 3599 / NBRC 0793 / NRRL Y-1031 F-60-10) TaxID=1206466 RepID=K0KZJ4_WICCF|nr:Carbonic anhydrase 2 [Wickerhamomyces ciferrii]CCH46563.1 Carbonic anhydrase 2 [Wickerhamomyces ciferrii]
MDARLHPTSVLGINLGEAHIIRNAGGRAQDALRSIIISQRLLGTREILIIHHTDCGMLTFNDFELRLKLNKETNEIVDHLSFLPFDDLRQSIIDDIKILQSNPLILDVPITGYIYNVKNGSIEKVE